MTTPRLGGTTQLPPPTERQIAILRAYLEHGSHRKAAQALGIREVYARQQISLVIKALRVEKAWQAGVELGIVGSSG